MVYSPASTQDFGVHYGDTRSLWSRVEKSLRDMISVEEIEDWFDDIRLLETGSNKVILGVRSGYRRDYIEGHYSELLAQLFSNQLNRPVQVEIHLVGPLMGDFEEAATNSVSNYDGASSQEKCILQFEPLNNKYEFDNFVVGTCNKMAHAAAQAVSISPAQSYNPLFVYGGVGLGKTHLMQATGNTIICNFPNKRVLYLSAEQFVNSFIDAIKRNERLSFQNTFRNVDVLLIDDIHFLAGKESTQEEFFHTFNALHNRKKQIVISCDRPPKDIPTIEDRLRSRFEWGLIVDIAPPDFEMRMAILRQKCDLHNIFIQDDVLEFVASKVRFSIRELEGSFSKVTAHAQLTGEPIDIEFAAMVMGEIYDRPVKDISIEKIQRKVAEYFNIKASDIIGKNRSRSIARPRQIAMYLSRKLTRHSYPEIGTFFGNKDHTTVMFACKKINEEMETDPKLRSAVERITEQFSQY